MTEDLDLDSLLQAAEALISKRPSRKEINLDDLEPQVFMLESKGSYTCLQCGRIYHGVIKHLNNQPAHKNLGSCPRCQDEESWWKRRGFTVERVEEPEGLFTTINLEKM